MKYKYQLAVLLMASALAQLSAGSYSLEQYLSLVEENSRDLELAGLDRNLAENRKDQASSAVKPFIGGSVSYQRNILEIEQSYPVGASPLPDPDYGFYPLIMQDITVNRKNDYKVSLGIQQTLFDMKAFTALKASEKYIDLTGSVYEATRQGVLTGAKKLYYRAVLLDKVYQVKKATEENAYEMWEDTQLKFQNELASELNVLQAEVNWQMKIPETTQARRNRDLAMANLKHLAGIDLREDVILTDELMMISRQPDQIPFGDILASRPDYRALQAGSELSEINLSAQKSEFFPSLKATAGYGWQKSDDALDLSEGRQALQVGFELSIPVYYGGIRFARMEEARIGKDKAELEILKKHEEIAMEISNLNLLLEESLARIESAESTLLSAEKAYDIMEVSSRNGLATPLDLNDSLLNLEGAGLNYYMAVYDYLDAYFSWQQAIGKGDELPAF